MKCKIEGKSLTGK